MGQKIKYGITFQHSITVDNSHRIHYTDSIKGYYKYCENGRILSDDNVEHEVEDILTEFGIEDYEEFYLYVTKSGDEWRFFYTLRNKVYAMSISNFELAPNAKIIDLMCIHEEDMLQPIGNYGEDEISQIEFDIQSIIPSSLDYVDFDLCDVRPDVFVINDGGDLIVLRDGRIFNVCWRGDECHVWKEDGRASVTRLVKKLMKQGGLE